MTQRGGIAQHESLCIAMPTGANPVKIGLVIALLVAGGVFPSGARAQANTTRAPSEVSDDTVAERDEENEAEVERQSLRERLTEREDENRLRQPLRVQIAGRPLLLSGELELRTDVVHRTGVSRSVRRRALFESELEAEAFYSFSPNCSAFAQLRVGVVDALKGMPEDATGGFLERGEMWLYAENFAGLGWDVDVGRLAFEDERRWWWDEELDAVRLQREHGDFALSLALARELAARTTETNFIDPDQAKVRRLIFESSWDWAEEHALQVFALDQNDASQTPVPGESVRVTRIDHSDADLRWLGARATGAIDLGANGQFAYSIDAAQVRGSERTVEFDDDEAPNSAAALQTVSEVTVSEVTVSEVTVSEVTVSEVKRARVRGHAVDLGLTWALPGRFGPRFNLGYAIGSGDRDSDDALDQAFRQTGLEANESGFGGVQRFSQYGIVLAPELSNLAIFSTGFGLSLLQSSSIDLRYSRYRLRELNGELRDTRIELALPQNSAGDSIVRSDRLGEALDLVLAIEEGERFELELQLGGFRPAAGMHISAGSDPNAAQRKWFWAGVLAFRAAF